MARLIDTMPKLVYIVTHPMTANILLRGQLTWFREKGFDVTVISSPGQDLDTVREREGVKTIPIPMARTIHPVNDCISLIRIYRALRKLKPDIVNASTPKAGLLGMIAAWMLRVPVRIYLLRGLRLETERGFIRLLLTMMEAIACFSSHRVICVSKSLLQVYPAAKILPKSKITVLASGSSNGVDAERFLPGEAMQQEAQDVRVSLGIPPGAPVIGFVGRLARDKGFAELSEAFQQISARHREARLLLVGDWERESNIAAKLIENFESNPHVVKTGFVNDTAPYYKVMDVLAFPSYREGFPNVPLEAAVAGVPCVGFHVTGTVDAVVDGETGTLVSDRDAAALADAVCRYLENHNLREDHGRRASARAIHDFNPTVIREAWLKEYSRLLQDTDRRANWYPRFGKRFVDLALTIPMLILLLPFLLILAVLIRIKLGSPVLFLHKRPGLHGEPFHLIKFRTMTIETDDQGRHLPDSHRLTPFGRFLRSTSLDELPQLINVLRGDLSLVGPRPLLMQYLELYSREQMRRHEVLPGITGWAQVNGRNALDWIEKFRLDVWYVDHLNFRLDLKILALTAWKALKREGINMPGSITTENFMGNDSQTESRTS